MVEYRGKNKTAIHRRIYIMTACKTHLDAQSALGLRKQTEIDECPIRSGDTGSSDAATEA